MYEEQYLLNLPLGAGKSNYASKLILKPIVALGDFMLFGFWLKSIANGRLQTVSELPKEM